MEAALADVEAARRAEQEAMAIAKEAAAEIRCAGAGSRHRNLDLESVLLSQQALLSTGSAAEGAAGRQKVDHRRGRHHNWFMLPSRCNT